MKCSSRSLHGLTPRGIFHRARTRASTSSFLASSAPSSASSGPWGADRAAQPLTVVPLGPLKRLRARAASPNISPPPSPYSCFRLAPRRRRYSRLAAKLKKSSSHPEQAPSRNQARPHPSPSFFAPPLPVSHAVIRSRPPARHWRLSPPLTPISRAARQMLSFPISYEWSPIVHTHPHPHTPGHLVPHLRRHHQHGRPRRIRHRPPGADCGLKRRTGSPPSLSSHFLFRWRTAKPHSTAQNNTVPRALSLAAPPASAPAYRQLPPLQRRRRPPPQRDSAAPLAQLVRLTCALTPRPRNPRPSPAGHHRSPIRQDALRRGAEPLHERGLVQPRASARHLPRAGAGPRACYVLLCFVVS